MHYSAFLPLLSAILLVAYCDTMSLSFVSKAIQTTTEDGTFEEQPVEHAEETGGASSVTGGGSQQQGLFEQLRHNQEEAEAEREEQQRSLMRGTLALDEDDAAHLEQLHRQRQDAQARQQRQTHADLAAFRAAQADRQHSQQQPSSELVDGTEKNNTFDVVQTTFEMTEQSSAATAPSEKKLAPSALFVIKKKRKRAVDGDAEGRKASNDDEKGLAAKGKNERETADGTKINGNALQSTIEPAEKKTDGGSGGGISSLLVGYSSSSSEEEGDEE